MLYESSQPTDLRTKAYLACGCWLKPGLRASEARYQPLQGPVAECSPICVSVPMVTWSHSSLLQERLQDQQVGLAQVWLLSNYCFCAWTQWERDFVCPFWVKTLISPSSVGLVFPVQGPPPLCPRLGSLTWGLELSCLQENLCDIFLLFMGLPTREDGIWLYLESTPPFHLLVFPSLSLVVGGLFW